MSHRFDATLKDIVAQYPADFAAAFGLPDIEPASSLNVDLSTVSAATDVALGSGKPISRIFDLNFQSGPDQGLPGRLHLYNAALYARYSVPVESVLVLLRPTADSPHLTGKLSYGETDRRVEFGYSVIRLWEMPAEALLRGRLAALPLAVLGEMPEDEPLPGALRKVVREIILRLESEASHAEAVRLITATYILTGLRLKKDELSAFYQGVPDMQELMAYDEWIEADIKNTLRILLRMGRKRFGPPDAVTETELTSIKDMDRLDRLTDAILTAKSWQELSATS